MTKDLYGIMIDWVAERQREGKLNPEWCAVQSFNGDKLLTLPHGQRPIRGGGPYIIVYDDDDDHPRYEAHSYVNWSLGFVEIIGQCEAADPKFFDLLFLHMVNLQFQEASIKPL